MSDKLEKQNLPVLSPDGSFNAYLQKIRKFPMLDAAEEYILAKNWRDKGDKESAHKLVTSHLRLVAKIATGYRGYGLPMSELVSEGNIGLMTAVKKFDPEKGFRLATYAMWWIKASMQEYILRSWSLVKIGTTAAQKKLFFNLRKMKNQIMRSDQSDLLPDQVTEIANRLDVTEDEVSSMEQRMKESLKFLQRCAEIQVKKSNDYQNPNSRVKQADYYPRGCATLLDTMYAKVLRMQSVLEAMEHDPNYEQNFESLVDSCVDLANYASFFAAYMNGGIEGQDPNRDLLNRPKKEVSNETID